MLRASIEYLGGGSGEKSNGNLRAVTEGSKTAESGVVYGAELTTFAEASVEGGPATLATARDALREAAGAAALVDAAAIVANFQRMVRISDSAGISLDAAVGMLSEDFREELGLNQFESAGRTRELSWGQRALAPLLRGIAHTGLRIMGRRSRKRT